MPPPSRPWILVCPSSRGIGRAVARHLLCATPADIPVLATTRRADVAAAEAALLEGLPPAARRRLAVVRCDVADEASVAAAAEAARRLFPPREHHLHLACALPGVLLPAPPERGPAHVDAAAAVQAFRVNAVGPLLLAKHFFGFLPRRAGSGSGSGSGSDSSGAGAPTTTTCLLPRHATWLNMSARVGSTADNRTGGWFAYRASKAAVNSLTRSLDVHLRLSAGDAAAAAAMAVAYHPGTVRTRLSEAFWASVPAEQLFSPEHAAERLLSVVCGLRLEQRGRCWDWAGKEVPP